MFETSTQTAEIGPYGGRRWRRRRWERQGEGGGIDSREAVYGEAAYGPGEFGESESGEAEFGETGYGPGGYGEAESEAGYGPGEFGEGPYGPGGYGEAESEAGYGPGGYGEAESEAGYGPGGYGEAESEAGYGPGGYGEAESEAESEEQFLPLIPIVGKVLGGLLGGLMKEAESPYAAEFGEAEAEAYGEGEAGEAEEQFLHKIFMKVLGQEAEDHESVLSPAQEAQFAARLMEVSSEAEMDEFLSRIVNTIGRAVQGIGGAVNSPQGRALVEAVKPLARAALPVVGGAIGSAFAPGVGTQIGTTLGTAASNLFEMEVPGETEAEQQFEVARRVVRLTSAAAQDVATAPAGAPPQLVGELSVFRAARSLARPLFGRALRAISPVARGFYGRRYGGYRGGYGSRGWGGYRGYRGYGGYGRYGRYGAWGAGRPWGYRGYGYRPGYAPYGYPPPAEPGPAPAPGPEPGPAPEPAMPPAQPGYRWVAVPIGAPPPTAPPPPPEGPPPADAPPPGGAPAAQSEFGYGRWRGSGRYGRGSGRYGRGYEPGYDGDGSDSGSMGGGPSGRWIRRAGRIILLDV